METKVLILTGHSGAGKDTVSAAIRKSSDIKAITPHTTRSMRTGEVDGDPYYFISNDDFVQMEVSGKFIEHASYITQFNGVEQIARYGTAFTSIPPKAPSVITIGVLAAIELKKKLGSRAYLVYLHVSDDVRESRAISRGSFDPVEWANRLAQDTARFSDGLPEGIDLCVDNMQPLEDTVKTILDTLK